MLRYLKGGSISIPSSFARVSLVSPAAVTRHFSSAAVAMARPQPSRAPLHLVVLVHGLHGTGGDMKGIADFISEHHGAAGVRTHLASSICGGAGIVGALRSPITTSMGILHGSRLLTEEIAELLASSLERSEDADAGAKVKLSLVGTSLGGLYARAAAAHLFESGRYDALTRRVEACNFVSFATPHLGVRGHLPWLYQIAVDAGAVGSTGKELMARDSIPRDHYRNLFGDAASTATTSTEEEDGSSKPLLEWMADPSLPYYHKALSRFSNRVLVGCTADDDKVPFHSSALLCPLSASAFSSISISSSTGQALLGDPVTLEESLKAEHPHITAVYRQTREAVGPVSPVGSSPSPASSATGTASAAGVRTAGLSFSAADIKPDRQEQEKGKHALAMESQMAHNLRSMEGGWTTALATFPSFGGYLLNHYRVSYSHPLLTGGVGADVASYVSKHLFKP